MRSTAARERAAFVLRDGWYEKVWVRAVIVWVGFFSLMNSSFVGMSVLGQSARSRHRGRSHNAAPAAANRLGSGAQSEHGQTVSTFESKPRLQQ
jgi:hypothetical protein